MTGIRVGIGVRRVLGIGGALLLLTGVALHAQLPMDPLSLDGGLEPGDIDHGATAPEVDLQAQVLAIFELSNGSTVTFLAVPEIGELGYSELVPAGAQAVLSYGDDLRALDAFLALAPLDVPIPRALIELDTRKGVEKLAVGRSLTDRLVEPVYILLDELGLEESGLRNQVGASHYCDSAAEFASDNCKAQSGHNCNLVDFCHAGLWASLTLYWGPREASYSYTSACGTEVKVQMQVDTNRGWSTLVTQMVPDGFNYFLVRHGPKELRRVVRARQSSSGGFRAYTNFHNDC